MTLPNLIIAGVNKAGTTSLFESLAGRDDVAPSRSKETYYFSRIRYGEPLPPLEEYEAQFADAGDEPIVMESTPAYLYGGSATAEAIAGLLPDVRILLVLRDPTTRAFSWFRFARSRLMIPSDLAFRDYLARCEELGERAETEEGHVGFRALSGGAYDRYLPAWRAVFGDRLRVTWFERFASEPEAYLDDLTAWLGLPGGGVPTIRTTNRTTDVRSTSAQRVALRVNRAGERLWRRFPRAKDVLRDVYYRFNADEDQQRLGVRERAWLREHFAPHVDELREQLTDDELDRAPAWVRGEG